MFYVLKMAAVLIAAILIGNWFLKELHKARMSGAPWYKPYLSIPGLLILLVLLLPIIIWALRK